MKKTITAFLLAAMMGTLLMGCGKKESAPESTEPAVTAEESTASEEASITGTIDEIKDSMFVITTAEGTSYAFDRSVKGAEAIADFQAGDEVVLTYSGTLTEVDPFQGEIISIVKK